MSGILVKNYGKKPWGSFKLLQVKSCRVKKYETIRKTILRA